MYLKVGKVDTGVKIFSTLLLRVRTRLYHTPLRERLQEGFYHNQHRKHEAFSCADYDKILSMNHNDLYNYLISEYNHPFSGWDFSYLDGRRVTIQHVSSWNYTEAVRGAMAQAQSLLDMDTGGGERLAALQPLPTETCATEPYAPNVPIARQRLEPLGVKVYEVTDNKHLPFADNQFDLITNRHGYYYEPEIQRILKPGHQLITQQVGGRTMEQLNSIFGVPYTYADWSLEKAVTQLQAAGLQIVEQREEFLIERFYDVGAIAYYLKIVPWQIPGFSVEKYFDRLVTLHEMIQADGYFEDHFHTFFIIAQKRKLP